MKCKKTEKGFAGVDSEALFGQLNNWTCKMCNYEGDFSDDIATMHAVEDDMLHSYTEEEKGEVYDKYD